MEGIQKVFGPRRKRCKDVYFVLQKLKYCIMSHLGIKNTIGLQTKEVMFLMDSLQKNPDQI